MGIPIRNAGFGSIHYLAFISVFTFFATRAGFLDYKKYFCLANKKHL